MGATQLCINQVVNTMSGRTCHPLPLPPHCSTITGMNIRPNLPQDEAAWRAGFIAGNLGASSACPYPPSSVAAWSWSAGHIEGAAQPRGTLPQLRPIQPPK